MSGSTFQQLRGKQSVQMPEVSTSRREPSKLLAGAGQDAVLQRVHADRPRRPAQGQLGQLDGFLSLGSVSPSVETITTRVCNGSDCSAGCVWVLYREQQSMIIPQAKEENKSLPPPPKASSPLKFAADLAAGGTAGGISKTVVAPIERVKLLLQTQVEPNPIAACKSGLACCKGHECREHQMFLMADFQLVMTVDNACCVSPGMCFRTLLLNAQPCSAGSGSLAIPA